MTVDVYGYDGPSVNTFICHGSDSQQWIWNATDRTVKNKHKGQCLTVPFELEVWAGLLFGVSQAIVLLNHGDSNDDQIAVKWSDIGFSVDHPAMVRDLWAHKDIDIFTGSYTSPKIDSHAAMMLKIIPSK